LGARQTASGPGALVFLAALLGLWAAHAYYSVKFRPEVLYADDWAVFRIPGYSRAPRLQNIFGTQNDSIAIFQNLLHYLNLIAFDLRQKSYIFLQNLFLLSFLLATWATLRRAISQNLVFSTGLAGALVVTLTGTVHFAYQSMSFVHQLPIVFLAIALYLLWALRESAWRNAGIVLCLVLSALAYLSGLMYLIAATVLALFLRVHARPGDRVPSLTVLLATWVGVVVLFGLAVAFTTREFPLIEAATNHKNLSLVLPDDNRFWAFLLITAAKGVGLPGVPWVGALTLLGLLVPPLALLARALRTGTDGARVFVVSAPVLGALAALAMISAGRATLAGADLDAVKAFANAHGYYFLHITFALPFSIAGWTVLSNGEQVWSRGVVIIVAHLFGFAAGLDGRLSERLNFAEVFATETRHLWRGQVCLENKVMLARSTPPGFEVFCPQLFPRDLRPLIARAEAVGAYPVTSVRWPPALEQSALEARLAAGAGAEITSGHVDLVVSAPDRAVLRGWAADRGFGRPADFVFALSGKRVLAVARVGEETRPDVAVAYKSPGLEKAGFELIVPRAHCSVHARSLQVWAASISGESLAAVAKVQLPPGAAEEALPCRPS
jgi:hypothetical protein